MKEDAVSVYRRQLAVAQAISGKHELSSLPPFPVIYSVLEPERGIKQLLLHVEKAGDVTVVQHVNPKALVDDILRYTTFDVQSENYRMVERQAVDTAKLWMSLATPLREKPKAVLLSNEKGYCYHRLPFTDDLGPTPLFDEFCSRMTNADAFRIFIGSLFYPDADRHQYLWMHGSGQDGKSTFVRFLHRVLGPALAVEQVPPRQREHFWSAGLLGKRLVVFPDCNNAAFPTTGLFKSLTGGDPVRVEPKGKDSYTTILDCKFMFLSNVEVCLESITADMRRIIYCELKGINRDADPRYEAALWTEAPIILTKCRGEFEAMASKGGHTIPCTFPEHLTATTDAVYETFWRTNFDIYPQWASEDLDKPKNQWKFTTNTQLAIMFRHCRIPKFEQPKYKAWAKRKLGASDGADPVWVNGRTQRALFGVVPKIRSIGEDDMPVRGLTQYDITESLHVDN